MTERRVLEGLTSGLLAPDRIAQFVKEFQEEWNREVEVYRRKVADLEAALNDPSGRDEAATALRGLIDAVVLYPGTKRGQVRAEFYGELAALLQLDAT